MTDKLRAAAEAALEALEYGQHTLKQVSETQWESRGELAMQMLRAALAEPDADWSLLKATQESLREHMAEIQRLRAALAEPEVQSTHSDDCYKWHHGCAIARIEAALKEKNGA